MRVRTEGSGQTKRDLLGTFDTYKLGTHTSSVPFLSHNCIGFSKYTVDEIHPNYPHSGGPFWSRSIEHSYGDGGGQTGVCYLVRPADAGVTGTIYNGMYRPLQSDGFATSLPADRRGYAESQGAEAYEKFSPLKPQVSLSQFLVELRDFPSLFQIGLKKFKDLGSNYLNYQFGWKPFLSDLRKSFASLKQLDSRIARLRDSNEQGVTRGGTLFDTTSETTISGSAGLYPSNYLTVPAGFIQKNVVKERCWFKGKYRYYIPMLDDERWGKFKALQVIYDLDVSPSVLWNVMPWSWLADWCSNAGSVIRNYQEAAESNLTSKYAYVMLHESTKISIEAYATGMIKLSRTIPTTYFRISGKSSLSIEQKIRVEASPFGFGLSWDSFSGYQLSILAALGISRFK